MVALVSLLLFGAVLVVHTAVAAVLTRFFRLRLRTQWGSMLYAFLVIPLVLLVSTLVFSGVLGIGVDLGSPVNVVAVMIAVPLLFGYVVDVLYMPSPDEYDLPETR